MKRGLLPWRRRWWFTAAWWLLLPWAAAGDGPAVAAAVAHDLWLEPSAYFAGSGDAEVSVTLQVGEHGRAEEAKPPRRADMTRFHLHRVRRAPLDLLAKLRDGGAVSGSVATTAAAASFHPEGGDTLLAMERGPKRLDLDAERFNLYLTEENQIAALARRAAAHQDAAPGRERYTRYLKTLVQDRDPAAAALAVLYRRRLGQRLEILLENNPGRLRPGQPVRVRVLFEGRPLAGVKITALHRERPDVPADRTLAATTDSLGHANLPPFDVPGPWLVRLVYVRPVSVAPSSPSPSPATASVAAAITPVATPTPPGPEDAQWESFWASYSFGVRFLSSAAVPTSTPAVGNVPPRRAD